MLTAPFPYFGGKRTVAAEVWERFGDVANYIEPFCGSCAVLLARPHVPRIETVNDADCLIANFWRAMKYAPEALARECDWPVNEGDLHARHAWLVRNRGGVRDLVMGNPKAFDVEAAAWWVWGIGQWIGHGWCTSPTMKKPYLTSHGRGIHRKAGEAAVFEDLEAWFPALGERLRRVRVLCGDWGRAVTPAVLRDSVGPVGVFLDPPYSRSMRSKKRTYNADGAAFPEVREWAIANGDNPSLRIALCGYEGEHDMPASWRVFSWSTGGGYGRVSVKGGRGIENGSRERIWFSPHCLAKCGDLFECGELAE